MYNMSFSLARINLTRNVKTRVFNDPAQYDTEVNAARGFSKPTKSSRVSLSQPVAQLNEAEKLMNVVSELTSSQRKTFGRNQLWIFQIPSSRVRTM